MNSKQPLCVYSKYFENRNISCIFIEHIILNNSRLDTEVGSVSFLSRAKIVYQGVAEVN
jgi:hypothetical protein